MKIDELFSLTIDRTGVTLHYREQTDQLTNDGKPITRKNDWYYPNIELALKAYLRKTSQLDGLGTIGDILKVLKRADEKIDEFVSTLAKSKSLFDKAPPKPDKVILEESEHYTGITYPNG